jgi:hypothetical protein
VDFSLWDGWHVTVFHSWWWFTAGLVLLIVGTLVKKLLPLR